MKPLLLALLFAACATEDEPEHVPWCVDIGAPDTLLCNRAGLCSWEGVECCIMPACPPGMKCDADPKCGARI